MVYIIKCSKIYYGLSISELKRLAYDFAIKCGIEYSPEWDEMKMAGRKWYEFFKKRHPSLTLRTPEQNSLNRAKAFCKKNVDIFFRQYDQITSETAYGAAEIWNMDESGFSTVPTKFGEIITEKGAKRVAIMASQEHGTLVTMALAVNAFGQHIPPFFVFPRKNMHSMDLDLTTQASSGAASESGWMKQEQFVEFMRHFIRHSKASKDRPALLLMDNHNSHMSIEALDLALEHGVTILTFPPHCSDRMQPLDVSVYGPLKTFYKSKCDNWMKGNAGKEVQIQHIPKVIDECLDLAVTSSNIKAGFRATGIWPYNPAVFKKQDFLAAEFSEENTVATFVEEQRNLLLAM